MVDRKIAQLRCLTASNCSGILNRYVSSSAPCRTSRVPLRAFAITRGLLFIASYLGLKLVPLVAVPGQWRAFPNFLWLDGWARWDSGWYWSIARLGWVHSGDVATNMNFFPVYSYVSLWLSYPLRLLLTPEQAFYSMAILVSNGAFLVALIGLYRLSFERIGPEAAERAVWLLALFPFSFFFSTVYAESLYLAPLVWSFYLAHRNRWVWACALMSVAASVRVVGFVAIFALGIEYLSQRGWRIKEFRRDSIAFALTPLGAGLLLGYCGSRYGDLLMPFHTHLKWGRTIGVAHLVDAVRALPSGGPLLPVLTWWYLLLLPVALVLTVHVLLRISPGLAAYTLGSLVLAYGSGLEGAGRFVAVLFPLFMSAGMLLRSRAAFLATCVLFLPFLLYITFLFSHWRHVT